MLESEQVSGNKGGGSARTYLSEMKIERWPSIARHVRNLPEPNHL